MRVEGFQDKRTHDWVPGVWGTEGIQNGYNGRRGRISSRRGQTLGPILGTVGSRVDICL